MRIFSGEALIFDFGGVIYKTDWTKANRLFLKKENFSILLKDSRDFELELVKSK